MPTLELWQPLSVAEVAKELAHVNADWMIAGGWAIDLFLGEQTREHADLDVLVPRSAQDQLHEALIDRDLWVADPPGSLRPLPRGEALGVRVQDIWRRRRGDAAWAFQIMLFDVEEGAWVFKRDSRLRRDLREVMLISAGGVRFLAPEMQLLYKAKASRPKDHQDFDAVLPKLDEARRCWLREQLGRVEPGHVWLWRL